MCAYMKRISFHFLTGACFLLLLGACESREKATEDTFADNPVFHATVETPSDPDAKTFMDAECHVYWNADDRVSIFPKKTDNLEFRFLGADGDKSGDFQTVSSYIEDGTMDKYYAASPFRADNTLSAEGVLGMTFPAVQTYCAATFDPAAQLMAAVSDTRSFSFRNVGCLLGFQLKGDGVRVSSLTLEATGGEKLSGKVLVTPGDAPTLSFAGESASAVTLTAATPVTLSADTPTIFWFVLPPVTLESGFTLTVTDADEGIFTKTLSRSITLERNRAYRMAAVEVIPVPAGPPKTPGIYPEYHTGGTPYVYDSSTDQINIYEAEGQLWVRFITPSTLRMREVGPIPTGVEEGDTVYDFTWSETLAGETLSSANYDADVLSSTGGVLTMVVGDTYFVLRF